MLFLPAQVLKGGFVTSWTPHMPSLVFEQKYLCRKCILWRTGIPSTPRRACPEQAPRWLGNTSVAQERTLCSWLLGRRRGEIWANPVGTARHEVPLKLIKAPCIERAVLGLQGCCDFCCVKTAGADTQIQWIAHSFWEWGFFVLVCF